MWRSIPVTALVACAVAAGTTPAAPIPQPPTPDEQERLLTRCKKFAEQGKIDLFVAAVPALKMKADDLRQWEPAVDFGRKMIERAGMTKYSKPKGTPSSYKNFADFLTRVGELDFRRMDEAYIRPDPEMRVPPRVSLCEAIQAPGVVDPEGPLGICDCLILSRGSVQSDAIQHSVVFANGDVTAKNVAISNVVVCDGDVTVIEKFISQSVIVARGNITAKEGHSNIVLMAGGKITLENKDDVIKSMNAQPKPGEGIDGVEAAERAMNFYLVAENKPNTLGVVFFELSTVGVEVKVADKAVWVNAVTKGNPCEKAGLKVGDTILDVNGKAPTDAESLRRLLRDALAVGDATVKMKRRDKTETVKVSLPE